MSSAIEDEILEKFLETLGHEEKVTPEMVAVLGKLLSGTGKLKPEDLVSIFAPPPRGGPWVIKIQSIRMQEVRGLRDLELNFDGGSFAISGPNGSGKSGVVDAIEFCLTGSISRLKGQGTAGITLQKHGPHVDRRDDPAAAEVSMTVEMPELGKTATITRNMKNPKELQISPDEVEIRAAVDEVAFHPEWCSLDERSFGTYLPRLAPDRGDPGAAQA